MKHLKSRRPLLALISFTALIPFAAPSFAADTSVRPAAFKTITLKSIYGQAGTLTTPTARHFKTGTLSAHIGTLDPYVHFGLGLQLFDGLHAQMRQSAEISSVQDDANRLFPGIDLKLRLMRETQRRPEISMGLSSAIGHKRMAGEYIAATKRFGDFDLTTGLGWGRFGSAAHFDNPLSALGGHFKSRRPLDGEDANSPDDWFTGNSIGFFGSITWQSPIDGLSLSADYGADRYRAEKAAINSFDSPAPYSIGASYAPKKWASFSVGLSGADKIMGQIHLSTPMQDAKTHSAKRYTERALPNRLWHKIRGSTDTNIWPEDNPDAFISSTEYNNHEKTIQIETAGQHETLPYIIGKASKELINKSYAELRRVEALPMRYGLQGPKIKILRRDLHHASVDNIGSAEEIWQNAQITKKSFKPAKPSREYQKQTAKFWGFTLENHISLNEEDNGTLMRSALLVSRRIPVGRHFLSINRARINLFNNLEGLKYLRLSDAKTVRGNVEDFAANRFGYDQAAAVYNRTLFNSLHVAMSAGYLEEMYFGGGAEILYRPFDKTWAIGAEIFDVIKRNPFTLGASGFEDGTNTITGHVNTYYEVPNTDATIGLSAGRYLAKEYGATLSIAQNFRNGTMLNGFVTSTQKQDQDVFGGTTHLYGGLNLSVPLGALSFLPNGSAATLKTSPLGRNAGQRLGKPFALYDETEQLSRRHIIQNWADITP
tara:strand:+ start:24417 stop:26558 length:2142 start_codon:yes stop_codon:yes gene_type:complete